MKNLSLLFMLMLLPMTAGAETAVIDGICYDLNPSAFEATVTKLPNDEKYSGSVKIPSSFTYNKVDYFVKYIGSGAFSGCTELTSVTIPDGVTSIGMNAFYGCRSLTSVTIPGSVMNILESAFSHCSGLTSVTIYNGVISIGKYAFSECTALTSVTIPNSVSSIGEYAFNRCKGLTSVTILHGVTSIGKYAFSGCTALTSVTIPSSITIIEENTFNGCSGLTSVTIPNSVTSIGKFAFSYCRALASLTIPGSVTSIGWSAFLDCTSLKTVKISDGVTSIDVAAFGGCTSLTSITIPASVTNIGGRAFWGCTSLTTVTSLVVNPFPSNAQEGSFFDTNTYDSGTLYVPFGSKSKYTSTSGWNLFKNITEMNTMQQINGIYYHLDPGTYHAEVTNSSGGGKFSSTGTYSGSVSIPYSIPYGGEYYRVTSIGDYAFYYCPDLTSVTIPTSVKSIREHAFYYCPGLTAINIPSFEEVSIGDRAFAWCTGLTSVTIPNTVKSMGESVFYYCKGLKSVTIGNGVTRIENGTFYNCDALTSVNIPVNVRSIGKDAFRFCSSLKSVDIPNSVTSIGENAFSNCTGLTSITIPSSVTSIESSAFYECSGMTSVNILAGVKSIGGWAFSQCRGLTSVTIPYTVTSIGNRAFENCRSLPTVSIPDGVTSIGDMAFYNCSGLTKVISQIAKPFEIDESVFSSNNGFTSATLYVLKGTKEKYEATPAWNKFQKMEEMIPFIDGIYYNLNSETKKAEVTNSSGGDRQLEGSYSGSVHIPPSVSYYGMEYSVTGIGKYAFNNCSGLTSVTIPDGVTSIGDYAFWNSDGLTSIQIPNSVTNIGSEAFRDCSGLVSLTIPSSVTSIDYGAFRGCSGLFFIKVESGNTVYDSRDNCNAIIKKQNNELISGCKNTIIPSSVTSIGESAFENCSGLTFITIPNSVTSIGGYAFEGCSGLTSITIPNSVTIIGNSAFSGCSGMLSVTSLIIDPFIISKSVFSCYDSATLYVPNGTKAKYEATSAWNLFQEIAVKGDVNDDGTVDVADIACIIDVMAGKAPEYKDMADVNKDKTVDVADIAIIIDIMAGKDVDIPEVQPNAACPDSNHPHWIDLGLPSGTKWACCNVGASKPEDYGGYYGFFDAEAYNSPSFDQVKELFENTTSEWTTLNGVNGRKFTGSNGGSVFLPATGGLSGYDGWFNVGSGGYYWTSTLNENQGTTYYVLCFESDNVYLSGYGERIDEYFVRPVRKD